MKKVEPRSLNMELKYVYYSVLLKKYSSIYLLNTHDNNNKVCYVIAGNIQISGNKQFDNLEILKFELNL